MDNVSTPSFEKLASLHPELEPGGLWRPTDCRARHHVAIVIPYRQREGHLKMFLNNMHAFLQRQQLEYGIYIVDQVRRLSPSFHHFVFFVLKLFSKNLLGHKRRARRHGIKAVVDKWLTMFEALKGVVDCH